MDIKLLNICDVKVQVQQDSLPGLKLCPLSLWSHKPCVVSLPSQLHPLATPLAGPFLRVICDGHRLVVLAAFMTVDHLGATFRLTSGWRDGPLKNQPTYSAVLVPTVPTHSVAFLDRKGIILSTLRQSKTSLLSCALRFQQPNGPRSRAGWGRDWETTGGLGSIPDARIFRACSPHLEVPTTSSTSIYNRVSVFHRLFDSHAP